VGEGTGLSIVHYHTEGGRNPYDIWLRGLRDQKGRTAVIRRVNRLANGNFGDHAPCRDGVWELKIDVGPGYRVYYAQVGDVVILLLGAGDKGSQRRDIEQAVDRLRDWRKRGPDP
jgi:putative addiction module killer protein